MEELKKKSGYFNSTNDPEPYKVPASYRKGKEGVGSWSQQSGRRARGAVQTQRKGILPGLDG